jgi:hypothetical protein
MICRLCLEKLPPYALDCPALMNGAIEAINPLTFRKAIMHCYCYKIALETCREIESSDINYNSRYDECLSKFA